MSRFLDKTNSNRDDITGFFNSTPGLIAGGVILVGFAVITILGGIFGWF